MNNPIEWLDKEIKRRADVVEIFPNPSAFLRLATAVVIEAHSRSRSGSLRGSFGVRLNCGDTTAPFISDFVAAAYQSDRKLFPFAERSMAPQRLPNEYVVPTIFLEQIVPRAGTTQGAEMATNDQAPTTKWPAPEQVAAEGLSTARHQSIKRVSPTPSGSGVSTGTAPNGRQSRAVVHRSTTTSHQRRNGAGRCPFAGHAFGAPESVAYVEVTSPADLWRDQPIIDAIDRWVAGDAPDGLALAKLISEHIRAVGKHFLSVPILRRLTEIRRQHGAREPFLDAFLDGILDKFESRYYNRTYLALPLLERICDDPLSGLDPERMSALLMADVVRFETAAAEEAPGDRPDSATLRKRITHALRFLASFENGNDGGHDLNLADVLETLPTVPATPAGDWFDVTVQPVYVVHDEYFFMRALQAHEMVFTTLAADLRAATASLRDGRIEDAVALLEHAHKVFARAAMLFRLVATMRPDHFHAFREFTQGASAIQSEQYKRFEIACGAPSIERLHSDAFTNVPAVQADAVAGHDDLSRAYLGARRNRMFTPDEWDVLDAALNKIEGSHQRWKATHHSLAARLLGEARGSGDTAGVPYLRKCLDNRLFWRLGEYLDASRTN